MIKHNFETIKYEVENKIARVMLNRPDVHNAFNDKMIKELTSAFITISDDNDTKVVILTGEGKSFCAGADLNWMKKIKD